MIGHGLCHQDLGLMEEDKAKSCQLQFNITHALIKVYLGHYEITKQRQISNQQDKEKAFQKYAELDCKGKQEVAAGRIRERRNQGLSSLPWTLSPVQPKPVVIAASIVETHLRFQLLRIDPSKQIHHPLYLSPSCQMMVRASCCF